VKCTKRLLRSPLRNEVPYRKRVTGRRFPHCVKSPAGCALRRSEQRASALKTRFLPSHQDHATKRTRPNLFILNATRKLDRDFCNPQAIVTRESSFSRNERQTGTSEIGRSDGWGISVLYLLKRRTRKQTFYGVKMTSEWLLDLFHNEC